jgi:hypothetical protein
MYARNVTAQTSPEKVDEAIQLWRESVAPSTKEQKDFKGAYLFVERSTGKIRTVGLWETESDLQASVGWNQEQIAKFVSFFSAPATIEHFEVIAQV